MYDIDLYKKVVDEETGNIAFEPYNLETMTIRGKNIKEINEILAGLDAERITDMKLTMKNLKYFCKELQKEMELENQRVINNIFKNMVAKLNK